MQKLLKSCGFPVNFLCVNGDGIELEKNGGSTVLGVDLAFEVVRSSSKTKTRATATAEATGENQKARAEATPAARSLLPIEPPRAQPDRMELVLALETGYPLTCPTCLGRRACSDCTSCQGTRLILPCYACQAAGWRASAEGIRVCGICDAKGYTSADADFSPDDGARKPARRVGGH